MKANSNQAVIATLARARRRRRRGLGRRAASARCAAGVPPEKIMFSGVGKTAREIALALDARHPLLQRRVGAGARAALRDRGRQGPHRRISIRVNPDVDAKTHAKIATGKAENKFGIPISRAREVYARAAKLPGMRVAGVDMHIGSQITELAAVRRRLRAARRFRARAARRRPRHRARRSRRRPRHSLSRGQRAAARSGRLCGDGQARDARPRLHG